VDIRREICRRPRVRPIDAARSILTFRTKQMAHRVLEMSGLLATTSGVVR
jgi:hypothetical protein